MGGSASAPTPDYEVVQAFAEAHPEVYGGVWSVGSQLHVGLTVMQPHAAVLRKLLRDPGSVTIRPVRFATAEISAVAAEVGQMVRASGTTWHRLGAGPQAAAADLGPDGSALARELHSRFGDRVEITVGGRAYPPDGTPVEASPAPVATREIPGLQLRAVLDTPRVRTGSSFDGVVQLLNTGRRPIRFPTDQPLIAVVVDRDSRVAGTFSGFTAGTGFGVDVAPGASQDVRFTGGTAGGSGEQYSTPPGSYTVVVPIPVRVPVRSGLHGELLTPPVPLEVTAATTRRPG